MALNTALLFDKPEYSDIIVSYSGRKTFCHKIIICQSSEYFKKLCGPGSHFAESKQDTIELKEDDPDAVYSLLYYVYTTKDHCGDLETSYAHQLEVAKCAQKYLYPKLHTLADDKFRRLLSGITEPTEVFNAIVHVRQASDDEKLLKIADNLEERQTLGLFNVSGFRRQIAKDQDLTWQYLDEYVDFKAGLEEMKLVWCNDCGGYLFSIANNGQVPKDHAYGYGRHKLTSFTCWVPKEGRDRNLLPYFNRHSRSL